MCPSVEFNDSEKLYLICTSDIQSEPSSFKLICYYFDLNIGLTVLSRPHKPRTSIYTVPAHCARGGLRLAGSCSNTVSTAS